MQEGQLGALKKKQFHLSIYAIFLLVVVFTVHKYFIIKTDNRIKYLFEQMLNTRIQRQWLPKLLEFTSEIQYKQ